MYIYVSKILRFNYEETMHSELFKMDFIIFGELKHKCSLDVCHRSVGIAVE